MDETHSAVHTIVSPNFTVLTQLSPELLKRFFGLGSWTGFSEFPEKQQSRPFDCQFDLARPPPTQHPRFIVRSPKLSYALRFGKINVEF